VSRRSRVPAGVEPGSGQIAPIGMIRAEQDVEHAQGKRLTERKILTAASMHHPIPGNRPRRIGDPATSDGANSSAILAAQRCRYVPFPIAAIAIFTMSLKAIESPLQNLAESHAKVA
jgi:hypothetical protein